MSKIKKVNSINGRKKRHSYLRPVGEFLDDLVRTGFVNNVGSMRIAPYHHEHKLEPVEVVGVNCTSKIQYLKVRFYHENNTQDVFLYSDHKNFLRIMNKIIQYCSRVTGEHYENTS